MLIADDLIGMVVGVELLDHAEDACEPGRFHVYGVLSDVHDDYICVDCWVYSGEAQTYDSNVKRFVVLRGAIVSMWELEAAGVIEC